MRKCVALNPKDATAYSNLGAVLSINGQWDEAIACYRKAIEIDPKSAMSYSSLGNALNGKGRVDEAIACHRKAIEINPKVAGAHNNLGVVLRDKGELDEAIACHRKAIEINPKDAGAHNNLGAALKDKGEVDEAIACFRKAIEINPKQAWFYYNLGSALKDKSEVDEAIACFRKAVEINPKDASFRNELAQAERLVAIRDKFAAFQKGNYTAADNQERIDLAQWCQIKKLDRLAADLYAAAFAADPKLADDTQLQHRYNAACYVARAAAGRAKDAAELDEKERTRLRQLALDWLRADLALRRNQLEGDKAADHAAALWALRHWQHDPDLAGVRDAAALAKLPGDERAAFAKLWADVATLLTKAEIPNTNGGK